MILKRFLVLTAISALTACGGGGGSSNDGPGPLQGVTMLPITEDTAVETTSTVLKSIDGAFGAGESAIDFGGAIGARIEGNAEAAVSRALDMALASRDAVVAATGAGNAVGAVISETQDCTGGGSVTVSIDTGSLSELEFTNAVQAGNIPAGTAITTEFANCIEEGEGPINGSVTIVIQQLSLAGEIGLDTFTIEFTATFDELETDDGRIDGDMSLLLVSTAGMTDARISGDALEVSIVAEVVALLDYEVTATEDTAVATETFDFTLRVASVGQLFVETLEAVRTNAFADNPISGVLRIVGASDGSITVTALDETSVQLDVDVDGDGTIDATIVTTWDELDS